MKRYPLLLAFALAVIAPFATAPLPAAAMKVKILVYNRTDEHAWITMYKSSLGKSIVCSWWAEAKKEMACEPTFGNWDADLWVRAEVKDARGNLLADVELFGTPRVMQNVTLYFKNGKYELVRGAPMS